MRTRWLDAVVVDAVVAVALTLALQVEVWAPRLLGADPVENRGLLAATNLALTLPLAWRRMHPWPVAVLVLGTLAFQDLVATPTDGLGNLVAVLLAAFSLGRWATLPRGYAGFALVVVTGSIAGQDAADHVFVTIVLSGALAAGLLLQRRMGALLEAEDRSLVLAEVSAEHERRRIARELHDVVTHRVTLMVVQCQVADTLLPHDPEGARTAVAAIEEAGRSALAELRSVLDLMQDGGTRPLPVPDLTALGKTVARIRAAGRPASFAVEGEARAVPPAVALAAQRIVEEALSNVLRHATGAHALVTLRYLEAGVEIEVTDHVRPLPRAKAEVVPGASSIEPVDAGLGIDLDSTGTGHGLPGMRARAEFLGGRLQAGPGEHGFTVTAFLPTGDHR